MSPGEPMVDGAVLDGLARLLEPQGAFEEELRAVGFDVKRPDMRYTLEVLLAVLDVCHRHRYPEQTREEAHRDLGRRFVAHFFDTLLGKVAATLLKALGIKRFLLRLPKIAAMITAGLKVEAEQRPTGEIHLVFRSTGSMSADFTIGAIEGAAIAGKFEMLAEIVRREAQECEVRITGSR